MIVPFQIYRHFKGNLYLVTSVAITASDLEPTVVYMSLNGDNQVWTRSLSEFESPVPEGKDNPTGQKNRFELVKDMRTILCQCTTENLIEELKNRPDSPFNELDIEGMNSKVVDTEYVLGELLPNPVKENDLYCLHIRKTLEEVKGFAERNPHRLNSRMKIYKNVLIEVESFD